MENPDTRPPDAINSEIENALREFIKQGKAQGNLRADLSEEAITTYIKFFQQGIANNQVVREKMKRDNKYSQDLFSLFMFGIKGQAG
jgi:hypothetical protein